MGSRIFTAFLIILTSIILLFLPISTGVYDFRTDVKEDSFTVTTGAASTNTTVSLNKAVYDDDTSTIEVQSDLSTDVPLFSSYNATTRATVFTGLTADSTRTLTVSYDYDALEGSDAINNIVGQVQWWWLLSILMLPLAALIMIFYKKGD